MSEIKKIGKLYPGQHWIELHGSFHPDELKVIVINLEKNIAAIKNKNNGNKK